MSGKCQSTCYNSTINENVDNDKETKGSGRMASTVIKKVETTVSTSTPTVDLTATNAEKALNKFIAAKEAIKALEEQKAAAEAELRAFLGESEVAVIRGVERFKLAHRTNSKINRDKLKTAFPEAYDATLESSAYTFIQTL